MVQVNPNVPDFEFLVKNSELAEKRRVKFVSILSFGFFNGKSGSVVLKKFFNVVIEFLLEVNLVVKIGDGLVDIGGQDIFDRFG